MLDLWLQPVDQASVQWAEARASILDEEETQRWQRYLTSESRELFLVAHVATRHVLSSYGDRAPESWQFDRGAHGRPELDHGPTEMRFNISHTEGMVAMLVHGGADCGVDVEHVPRTTDMRSVARRVFTEAEQQSIFSLAPESQSDRFCQLWTLKESFIKAKGKGFALPLHQFSFEIGDNHFAFACDPALDPSPERWQFFTHRTDSGHIVSIAIHRSSKFGGLPATTGANPPNFAQAGGLIRHLDLAH